jgi:hypothetical protein
MEKQCTKCKQSKSLDDFYKHKTGKFNSECKSCTNEMCKDYRNRNKEKVNKKIREWVENNRDKSRATKTKWREKNTEYHKDYYKKKVAEDPLYNSKNYFKDVERSRAAAKRRRQRYPKYNQEYIKKKVHIDDNFRLSRNLRQRVVCALRISKTKKSTRTFTLIGCSIEDLKIYLESKFLSTMTWENYGKCWQIDHIIPYTKFDLTQIEQQYKCFHYTNLQPLFTVTTVINGVEYIGNRNKGNRII